MRNTPAEQRRVWATYVKALRAATGMSGRALADRLGTNPATIWRWETAKTKPESPAVPERIAELFRLDLDEVLTAAGLKPATEEAPTEPTREPDPEVEEIQRSGLPDRIKKELIEHILSQRERDEAARMENLRRMIRLAGGRTG
jgi:transcriptional regulator with XRE-family HTH domain